MLLNVRKTTWMLVCLILGVGIAAGAEKNKTAPKKTNPPVSRKWEITDDPALPRVLIIGDSISIGYTMLARDRLSGVANVHRPFAVGENGKERTVNCAGTTAGLKDLDDWLGDKKWDVIHFNWGLHDLKFTNEKGGLVDPVVGRQQAPGDQYEKNLTTLTLRLKKTGARLIFATTTPYPEGCNGRRVEDWPAYNEIALRVMKREGVEVNDLCGFILPRLGEAQQPKNVHFNPAGSALLADRVAKIITARLSSIERP